MNLPWNTLLIDDDLEIERGNYKNAYLHCYLLYKTDLHSMCKRAHARLLSFIGSELI